MQNQDLEKEYKKSRKLDSSIHVRISDSLRKKLLREALERKLSLTDLIREKLSK